jgi:AcrR family transcriptional regulator
MKRPLHETPVFEMTKVPVPERRAKLLDEIVDYILSNGLAGLSLRPLAAGVNTSPRMLLYFFGSKEQLISDALAQIRLRQQADFGRALAGSGRRRERLLRAWSAWSSPKMAKFWRFCFGVYGLAFQNPKQFAVFLEQFIGDWLPPFEQALGAAGFSPERARSLARLSLAAMRGLQLDLLATGERARIDAAFREMLALLTLASRGAPNESTRRAARKKHRSTAAAGLEQDRKKTIVGGPARAKRRRH